MMGTEQFSLKWNHHTNHLVDVFGNLLQAESLVDVTLSCEGQSVKAHKLVLSACSPYFKDLFQEHTETHPIVILKDVKFAELRCIIEFMYKGEVEVEKNDLDSLFLTAESLKIKGLTGSRPPVGGVCLRVPPPAADYSVDRKRLRPGEPFDTGGGGGGGERGPPPSPPPSQSAPPCSNGDDGSVIKRPKLEPMSAEENSTDGMETAGAAGTAYLCRECGCSFHSQHQLQDHLTAAHGPGGAPTEPPPPPPPPPAGSGTVIRGPGAAAAGAVPHSHSWPPHDAREPPPLWGKLESAIRLPAYLQSGVRPELPFLQPLVGLRELAPAPGLGGGILGMMPLIRGRHMSAAGGVGGGGAGGGSGGAGGGGGVDLDGRGPLNLVVDGAGSPSASPSGDPSEPSTPTPTDDGAPVTCKVCTRTFESAAALREHAAVHQGERPFRCEWCGKAFKFRHHLKDHCRIHTGERPFDCKTCGKSFARSSILKTHTKIHRQEERRFELAAPFLAAGVPSLAELPASLGDRSPAAGGGGGGAAGERPPSLAERVSSLPDRPDLASLPTPPVPTATSPPPPPPAAPAAAPGSPVTPTPPPPPPAMPGQPAAALRLAEPLAEGSAGQ